MAELLATYTDDDDDGESVEQNDEESRKLDTSSDPRANQRSDDMSKQRPHTEEENDTLHDVDTRASRGFAGSHESNKHRQSNSMYSECAPSEVLQQVSLPPKVDTAVAQSVQQRVRALVEKADEGYSVSEQLRNDQRIRNPYFTSKLATHFHLAEHGSFMRPYGVHNEDLHTAIGLLYDPSTCLALFTFSDTIMQSFIETDYTLCVGDHGNTSAAEQHEQLLKEQEEARRQGNASIQFESAGTEGGGA